MRNRIRGSPPHRGCQQHPTHGPGHREYQGSPPQQAEVYVFANVRFLPHSIFSSRLPHSFPPFTRFATRVPVHCQRVHVVTRIGRLFIVHRPPPSPAGLPFVLAISSLATARSAKLSELSAREKSGRRGVRAKTSEQIRVGERLEQVQSSCGDVVWRAIRGH